MSRDVVILACAVSAGVHAALAPQLASFIPAVVALSILAAAALGYELRTLRAVVDVNRERVHRLVGVIQKVLDPLDGRVVAVLGLAFKPKTDDMREARSVELIARLVEAGARVRVYDPVAMDNARRTLPAAV